jgi:hypothetical protein
MRRAPLRPRPSELLLDRVAHAIERGSVPGPSRVPLRPPNYRFSERKRPMAKAG